MEEPVAAGLLQLRSQRVVFHLRRQHGDGEPDMIFDFNFSTRIANRNTFLRTSERQALVEEMP
jgi:hypothetical protein